VSKAAAKRGVPAARAKKAAWHPTELMRRASRFGVSRRHLLVGGGVLAALVLVASAYFAWDSFSNREVDYESALKASAGYKQYQVGVAEAQSERYPEAEDALRKAIAADGSNALIYNALATVYVQQQQFQKALVTCENGINNAPGSADLYYTLGLVRFHLGKYDDAEQALSKALQLRERFPDAHLWLGNTYLLQARVSSDDGGSFDQVRLGDAVASFRRAVALDPDTPEYLAALGEALYDQRDLESARDEYAKASTLDPKNAAYLVASGKIYDQLGDFEAAETSFEKATEADRLNAEAFYGLGLIRFKRGGNDEEAIAALREAVQINRYHADAHEKLGQALVRTGRQEEGDAEARLAEESRQRTAQLEQLRAAFAQQPGNVDIANMLGNELAKQGKYEEAFMAFQRAVAINPRNVDAKYRMAGIYLQKGNILEALRGFEEVDKLQSGYRRTNQYLAQIYRKIGRQGDAAKREAAFEAQRAAGEVPES
jgi:tetratricopeptide (TPR) repeat protein